MSSIYFDDNPENAKNVDVSQSSADLFEESPQYICNSLEPPNKGIDDILIENSSETSEEIDSIPLRKPRKALCFSKDSRDSSSFYDRRSSVEFENGIKTSPSTFFRPISPCNDVSEGSITTLEVYQSKYCTPVHSAVNKLSKENLEATSHISESSHSDSSILDDSLDYESCNQSSKKTFRTPLYSSVKKKIIHQWLSNVSLNCSSKAVTYIDHKKDPTSQDFTLYKNQDDSRFIGLDNGDLSETLNVKESETEHLGSNNIASCDNLIGNNNCEVYSSLKDSIISSTCDMTSNKSANISSQSIASEKFDANCEDEVLAGPENNISKFSNSTAFMQSSSFKKENESSGVESVSTVSDSYDPPSNNSTNLVKQHEFNNYQEFSPNSDEDVLNHERDLCISDGNDSTFNEVSTKKLTQAVGVDDESFSTVKFSRKNKNRFNISSDDSEAKDTANDSEDLPYQGVDPYTPRRRLYFRNPLNNSLDDDAKPMVYTNNRRNNNNVNIKTMRSTDIFEKICCEVGFDTVNKDSVSSIDNHSASINLIETSCNKEHFNSELSSNNKILDTNMLSSGIGPKSDSDLITSSKKNLFNSSDDIKSNLEGVSMYSSHDLCQATDCDPENNECQDGSFDANKCDVTQSPFKSPSELDESNDSVLHFKRKSKKNILNYSTDDNSFISNKSDLKKASENETSNHQSPICNGSFIHPPSPPIKTFVDLTKDDDEYEKYIYRSRSDSSCSEGNSDLTKSVLEDVITIHTTTSEEEGESDDNSPWFDLESYLKKQIPASSKSFDTSFLRNVEKRKAQLANISLPSHSSCPEHVSFLLSLTPQVPDEMCHPEAAKYRGESFTKNKNQLVNLLFKLYNRDIFDEKLPPLEIKWSGHLTTTSGITKSCSKITKNGKIRLSYIKLSKTVVDDAAKLRDVLLHELCHAANWLIDEQAAGHGPLFKKWVHKIWTIYPEVPKVKTTHHYELKWKYLYKCSYCGYELGKMKLSVDETKCRLCGGLVTVNS